MADKILRSLQQALQSNSKSTVLKSLGWLIAILSSSTIAASRYGLDKWLVIMFGILDGVAILAYIGFYFFFALKDPELLRSEKYTIQKMAIQHGFIGDDISGFVKFVKVDDVALLADTKSEEVGKEEK